MMRKKATASLIYSEMHRLVRERARGPYLRYCNADLPAPIPLPQPDASGCNWTVNVDSAQPLAALPFLDLILNKLMREYDLIQG
jgi:hypothetical protein